MCDRGFPAVPAVLAAQVADVVSGLLALHFDVTRSHYAMPVRTGWTEQSLLASRAFARKPDAMEHLTLGPWARHV